MSDNADAITVLHVEIDTIQRAHDNALLMFCKPPAD
jgi:hypothetical protein